MRKFNKKGFTLVELLAVIVILALIMAIAIYSISGILQTSRENVYKDTALSIIHGARNHLTLSQQEKTGTYYFTNNILSNDNELPFGGKILYGTASDGVAIDSSGSGTPFYRAEGVSNSCTSTSKSYVAVQESAGKFTYSICIVPDDSTGKILYGSETDLMGNTIQVIFDYATGHPAS